jgi:hypothetical protein
MNDIACHALMPSSGTGVTAWKSQASNEGGEQRLVDQARLDEAVGRAERQDGRPAAAGAPGHLPHQQGAAAVERHQEQQRGQLPDGDVAQQVLPHPRGEHEQADHGSEAHHGGKY